MWKSFFYYSKSERRAFIALLSFSLVLVGIIWWMPDHLPADETDYVSIDSMEIEAFVKNVTESEYAKRESFKYKGKIEPVLIPFDPNTVDSITLVKMGLPAFMAHNILKYRGKGGRFRTAESFSRVYGLREEQYRQLKPYIKIAPLEERTQQVTLADAVADTLDSPLLVKKERVEKFPEGTVIDIAVADTAQLKKVPGIGSGIAREIVSYRKSLGGFYSVNQLKEIRHVTPEMLKWFEVRVDTIIKLPINRAGLDRLRSHPYLNFYQAKVIVEYRRKRGKIKSLSQLSLYEEFTEKDLNRLAFYFSYD